jgi:hypothetical protein
MGLERPTVDAYPGQLHLPRPQNIQQLAGHRPIGRLHETHGNLF